MTLQRSSEGFGRIARSDDRAAATRVARLLAHAGDRLGAGRPADAIEALRAASLIEPSNAAVQHDLGFLCLQAGRLPDAVAAFEAALSAAPGFAQAAFCLGVALQGQGRDLAAIDAYRRAAALRPSLAEAGLRSGGLLETLGRRVEAVAAFRRAAEAAPETALGRLCAARALLAEERDAEAELTLRRLLSQEPGHAAASDMLGTVLADAGRFEEARGCYERAIAAAPHLAGSYYDLVRCRPVTRDDAELVARMRAAVASPGLTTEARLKVHLALGKSEDDLGDYAAAMGHFDAADRLRASLGAFDPAAFEARVDRVIARVTPDLVARASAAGDPSPSPVFVVGLPRSGTTLVEQILSSHPGVHGGGELPFWTRRGALWERSGDNRSFVAEAASDYLSLLRALAPDAARVTDKAPLNVMHAGLIHLALPRATIICCRRSPIDAALSIHRTYFNQHVAFPTGGDALVAVVRSVGRLVAHWRAVLPADRFIEVRYERLAADPLPEVRRMLAACGLPWDESCLRPERNGRVVRTPSKWQARQPIHAGAVEAWRRYEPYLGPLAALIQDGAATLPPA